jgi:hypothetical protein
VYEFDQLAPELRPYAEALLAALNDAGASPRVTSTLRSVATQKRLYDTYVAGNSKYPAAPPGFSPHEHGWAFDLSVNNDGWLPPAGDLWESWGGTWGGRFRDPIHFELGGASEYLRGLRESGQPPPKPPGASNSWYDALLRSLGF